MAKARRCLETCSPHLQRCHTPSPLLHEGREATTGEVGLRSPPVSCCANASSGRSGIACRCLKPLACLIGGLGSGGCSVSLGDKGLRGGAGGIKATTGGGSKQGAPGGARGVAGGRATPLGLPALQQQRRGRRGGGSSSEQTAAQAPVPALCKRRRLLRSVSLGPGDAEAAGARAALALLR